MLLSRSQRVLRPKQFYSKLRRLLFNDATKILSSDTEATVPSDTNFVDFVWKDHKKFENKIALTCGETGRSLTYGQAFAAIERLSVNLPTELGLQSQDNIALLLPNIPEYAIVFFAAASTGIVTSLINPLYTSDELWKLLDHSKAKAVITIPVLFPTVQEAMAKLPGGGVPVVLVGGDGSQKDTLDFEALVAKSTRAARRLDKPTPHTDIALPFSSGTTGVPKGVVISHHNLVAQAVTMLHAIPDYNTEPRSTIAIIPFFHIYGLSMFMGLALLRRMQVVSLPKFHPSTFVNALKTYKPSHLFLVPPLVQHMSRSPEITPEVIDNLRFISSGAAPITGKIVEEFLVKSEKTKPYFMNGYGMTETAGGIIVTPETVKYGEYGMPVGKLCAKCDAKIVDQSGAALPVGETGELWLRSPTVMKGYFCNEEATKDIITEDGWLRTGDQACFDANGNVYIVDRLKDIIKVKGFQVSPTEIEDVLIKMPGLADVAVLGVPVDDGEGPKAFVVRAADSEITAEDVHAFLEPKVAKFKKLSGGVEFVDQIPRSASGKILKKDLV